MPEQIEQAESIIFVGSISLEAITLGYEKTKLLNVTITHGNKIQATCTDGSIYEAQETQRIKAYHRGAKRYIPKALITEIALEIHDTRNDKPRILVIPDCCQVWFPCDHHA